MFATPKNGTACITLALAVVSRATGVKQEIQRAADAAGLGHLRSHTFRHTYRTWLDSIRAPTGVQQRLMRHADIRTTMNIYGDAVMADMADAHGKVVGLALNSTEGGLNH